MDNVRGQKKAFAIHFVKRNISIQNSIILVVIVTLFILNIFFQNNILDFINTSTIIALIAIITGLIMFSLYLSRESSRHALERLEKHHSELNDLLACMEDEISERKEAEKQLKRKVFYDELTGLPNRTMFTKQLNRKFNERNHGKKQMFAVLLLDLDGFKVVNDSMGHDAGNKLLVQVAERLRKCIRNEDIIARFAGDEFAIFFGNISHVSETIEIAQIIQNQLKRPFHLNGQNIFTSASIGIATDSGEMVKEEDFLRNADIAMYHAKLKGRARYQIFNNDMYDSIIKRVKLEADMRLAIEREEFLLHYQPIVSVREKKIVAVEALVRWNHPERGMISPLEFIPLAEDTGLISDIGKWVLRNACTQQMIWEQEGHHLCVDINVSAIQFRNQDISVLVEEILRETGMDPGSLDIEVTESIAMQGDNVEMLNRLSAMGIGTSIDDFGTGYSSLGSLKRFPINALKIDKSFIKDITTDPDIEAIVMAIIAMAHTLKMKVVAEGVETMEQLSFLEAHDCDSIQGYLCSPPIPADEIGKLLKKIPDSR